MSDLDKLIEAVEANYILQATDAVQVFPKPVWLHACEASQGSLDAAKRLHDALLPGWIWNVVDSETTVWPGFPGDPGDHQTGYCEGNPARAWLLAILQAVKAKGAG